jgi:hypothetical protein
MRQFSTGHALLWYNGLIEHKYGSYDEGEFSSNARSNSSFAALNNTNLSKVEGSTHHAAPSWWDSLR